MFYIKEGTVLLLLFPSLSLSPLTFKIWSMCLLFCFEWMLCCGVVCEKKLKNVNKKKKIITMYLLCPYCIAKHFCCY